jgi:hypothetical protein
MEKRTRLRLVSPPAKTRGVLSNLDESGAASPAQRALTHTSLRMNREIPFLRGVAGVTNVDDHQS